MERGKARYSIGELSEICGISKKTLRFYDEKELLKPSERDEENNYRYYSQQQVMDAIMIREMKLRGFTLTELNSLLKYHDMKSLQKELGKKIITLEKEISDIQKQLDYSKNAHDIITKSLEMYSNANSDKEEIKISYMPEMSVLFTQYRCKVIANELFWDRFIELHKLKEEKNLTVVGPFTAIFHDHYFNQFFFDYGNLEVFLPIKEFDPDDPNIKKYGGFEIVSKIFIGKYSDLLSTYVELVKYIDNSNYTIVGPGIEEYLVEFSHGVQEDQCVTKISFPIEKIK